MTPDIQALQHFLDASGKRTPGEWDAHAEKVGYIDEIGVKCKNAGWSISQCFGPDKLDNAHFIAASSRIAPELRALLEENERWNEKQTHWDNVVQEYDAQRKAMQDAFEQVCEALSKCQTYFPKDTEIACALSLAAPFRKTEVCDGKAE